MDHFWAFMSIFNSKVLDSWRLAAIPGNCATHVFASWVLDQGVVPVMMLVPQTMMTQQVGTEGTIGNHWEPLEPWEPCGQGDPKWPQVTRCHEVSNKGPSLNSFLQASPGTQIWYHVVSTCGKRWDLPTVDVLFLNIEFRRLFNEGLNETYRTEVYQYTVDVKKMNLFP